MSWYNWEKFNNDIANIANIASIKKQNKILTLIKGGQNTRTKLLEMNIFSSTEIWETVRILEEKEKIHFDKYLGYFQITDNRSLEEMIIGYMDDGESNFDISERLQQKTNEELPVIFETIQRVSMERLKISTLGFLIKNEGCSELSFFNKIYAHTRYTRYEITNCIGNMIKNNEIIEIGKRLYSYANIEQSTINLIGQQLLSKETFYQLLSYNFEIDNPEEILRKMIESKVLIRDKGLIRLNNNEK